MIIMKHNKKNSLETFGRKKFILIECQTATDRTIKFHIFHCIYYFSF